jgi:2-polyprenyl-6-methoxyphenol hydroxylase-like FAD-dependent oxidoreductase
VTGKRRAVVIGASMAGLLTARVLSESFADVTVLDRDALPEAAHRTGVPQARHLHGLLARGRDILDGLFPGLSSELQDKGAVTADLQGDIRWTIDGHRMCRARSGLEGLSMSRPLLECAVRARVGALPGVRITERCQVVGLTSTVDNSRITGVRTVHPSEADTEGEVRADLVVDASGRGSRTPIWLAELGYAVPDEDTVRIDITYATQHYRREARHLPASKGAVVTLSLDNPRGGAVACEEGGRWIVTLAGIHGDDPPLDRDGFVAFAATLPDPAIGEVVATAVPLDEPLRARFPASVRRRYERLSRFPEGYLVVGDAVCSFNPIYSQGMTVAAVEALELRRCLNAGTANLAPRFFRRAARVLSVPWMMATSSDRRFGQPSTRRRALPHRLVDGYIARLGVALEHDPAVGLALLRTANLLARPERLFAPDIALRVLRGRGGRRSPATRPSPEHSRPIASTSREEARHDDDPTGPTSVSVR